MKSAKGQQIWEAREQMLRMATEFHLDIPGWDYAPVHIAKCRYTGKWVVNWLAKNCPKGIHTDDVYSVPKGYDLLEGIVKHKSFQTATEAMNAAKETMRTLLELQPVKK